MVLPENLKIAVVGTGAVGGYYGALLARAGVDIHFLLRRDYEAVRKNGLQVRLHHGERFVIKPLQAHTQTASIGPCDLVIIGLKASANTVLPQLLTPLVKEETLLLTLQNGLGNTDFLAQQYTPERVLGGLCFICLNRVAPGVIENFYPGYLSVGEYEGPPQARTRQLVTLFERAGTKVRLSESLGEALWRKLFWNVPFNGLTIAAGGITTDKVLADKDLNRLARILMGEIQTAAKAHGYDIPEKFIQRQFDLTRPMGAYKPSSLIDYLEHREVEVEAIWGEPLRRGRSVGVLMPHLETLYGLLKSLVRGRLERA